MLVSLCCRVRMCRAGAERLLLGRHTARARAGTAVVGVIVGSSSRLSLCREGAASGKEPRGLSRAKVVAGSTNHWRRVDLADGAGHGLDALLAGLVVEVLDAPFWYELLLELFGKLHDVRSAKRTGRCVKYLRPGAEIGLKVD